MKKYYSSFFFYPCLLATLLVCSLLTSCDDNLVLQKVEVLKGEQWDYADAKTFTAEIADTVPHYNISIILRHGFNFEWRNLWVKIETTFPNGQQFERRVNLVLSGPDGVWHGDCLGDNCDIEIPIQDNAFFPLTGKYTFKLSQDMRANPLGFMKSVGMKVEKATAAK